MSDSRFSKCQILKDNILIQNILISIGVHPIFRILCMILHKPTGIIFKNRKEAKIFFGTSRYRKIEKEKQEIIAIADIFRAKVVDVAANSLMIELTGNQNKLDAFLNLMADFEVLEMVRTGITGLGRGVSTLN